MTVVAVILAIGGRMALDPWLGDQHPFATLFLAVLVVAGFEGRGPALLAVGMGALGSVRFLIPPRDGLAIEGLENQVGLVLYVVVGIGIGLLGGALRASRERSERLARESDQRWQQLRITLNSIGDAVVVTDFEGRVVSLNPVAENLTGWPSGEAIGQPLDSLIRLIQEKTRAPVENPALRSIRAEAVITMTDQTILIGRDGREHPVEETASPIRDESGRVSGVVLIFRDVTERRAAEIESRRNVERLRLFVEHAPAAVAMLDHEMRYLLVSRRWHSAFELGEANLIGRGHYELFPHTPDRLKDVHRCSLRGEVRRAEEDLYLWPDGRQEWHRWETRPWLDDSGKVGGIIILIEVITDQVRNRQVIREHAEALSGILDASVDHIYVVDREGRYRFVSAGGAKMLGFEPGEMDGQHWSELGISAEFMSEYLNQFAQVFRSGEPAQHETIYHPTTGEPRHFEYTMAPIIGEGGGIDSIVVVSRDVSRHRADDRERIELMKTLETRNAFINAVLSQVPAAIVVSDSKTGEILLSNHEAHRIVQHNYEPGRTLDDYGTSYILEAFRPDGTRYGPRDWPLVRAQRGETVLGEEITIRMKNRSRLTIRANAGPIRVGEEVVAAVVAYHDITDQKAAELSARFLADASVILAGLVDYNAALQKVASLAVPAFADWAVVDILGADGSIERLAVAHADPAKSDLAFEVHRRFPADPSAPYGPANVIRTGRAEFVHEFTEDRLVAGATSEDHIRLIRELGLCSYMCVPLLVRGEILGVIGFASAESGRLYLEHDLAIAEDLAARASIAIENARLYEELKEADRMKDEFLATLAHELRNPLAPIRNALHLMKRENPGGDEIESDRAMAERQVVHLTRLIDDLMDVARISRGKIELHKEVVDLATIVRQAVETSRPQIEERRHQLAVSIPEPPISLEADPTRLEQVLWNLLNNAAKYSNPGGRIDLNVVLDGTEVRIRLKDSGIGIKAEMLGHIFDMFTQVDDHRDHAAGGLGIGLSLVRALVELHGGSIAARSDGPGQGSEFIVTLPVLAVNFDPATPTSNPTVRPKSATIRRRVLVVDDNEDAARSLARLLTRLQGQETRVAHDGPSALELAEVFRPEVILLDIGLPVMDGFDVARSIRGRTWGEDVVIIALTGWGQEEDRRRSREAGFDHHLVKPVDPILLEEILAEYRPDPAADPSVGS